MAQLLTGSSVGGKPIASTDDVPTKTSQLTNDSGYTKDEITIDTTQPTTNLWYKVVG